METVRENASQIAARGREIFEHRLRGLLEPDNNGKFIVIDVETGDYEIDEDDLIASMRAYNKRPEGVCYGMRIGYSSAGTLGASQSAGR
jgi:hypothetical protein